MTIVKSGGQCVCVCMCGGAGGGGESGSGSTVCNSTSG